MEGAERGGVGWGGMEEAGLGGGRGEKELSRRSAAAAAARKCARRLLCILRIFLRLLLLRECG